MPPLAHQTSLYPFRLMPVVKDKVWGGRYLSNLGKQLPPGKLIGETWEAWDGCLIENGQFAGQTLAQVIESDASILGSTADENGRLPLLFKFIDAQQDLSVQVHPDDAEAQAFERQPRGKTEAWYILHAEPGAKLILGFNQDVTPEQVTAHIRDNTLIELMATVPVQPGDVLFVPAGTVHAIGAGVVLAEIQENSDITYRLYDWGRDNRERPLHIEESLRVLDFGRIEDPKIPSVQITIPEMDHHRLIACRYFALDRLDVRQSSEVLSTGGFQILATIEGQADIYYGDPPDNVAAEQGRTVFVPASVGTFRVEPRTTECKILRAFVPDLTADVVAPLRHSGYDDVDIARLGGAVAEHNDVMSAL